MKLIAAAFLAVFCVMLAAGCGCGKEASPNADTSAATQDSAPKYEYSVANTKLKCRTDINEFIKDKAVDMDALAQSIGWEKTDKAGEWTAAADGARYLVTLSDVKDGVYPGVTVTQNTMDGKKNKTVLTFTPAGKSELYTYDKGKLTLEGIAVAAYAMENAAEKSGDPFNIVLSRYKNDKGEFVLTEK